MTDPVNAPLAALASLLAEEPALRAVIGREPVVAVPDPARALFVAALAHASTRRPIVVAVPTLNDADRLVHDLAQFLPAGAVEEFPAWETLPFERVSPSVETMGRRLRVMWRLRSGDLPTVLVAPVRALVQRLGPARGGRRADRRPSRRRTSTATGWSIGLVDMGYRREYQVEARGEVAVRGSIVDVYPSTARPPGAHRPLGRRGRPAHRVLGRRPAHHARRRRGHDLPRPRAAPHRRGAGPGRGARARAAVGGRALGAPRRGAVVRRHGVVAAVALRAGPPPVRPAPAGGPRAPVRAAPHPRPRAGAARRRSRARRDARHHVGCGRRRRPAPVAPVRPPARAHRGRGHQPAPHPRVARHPAAPGHRLRPGRREHRADRAAARASCGPTASAWCSRPTAPAAPRASPTCSTRTASTAPATRSCRARSGSWSRRSSAARCSAARRSRSSRSPTSPVAGACTGGSAARASRSTSTRTSAKGDYVVHQTHGVARYDGMVTRAIGGAERDYLLLEYKGNDKLYVPTDQVGTVRKYTGGDTPTLHRMGGADFEKSKARVRCSDPRDRAGARRAVPPAPRDPRARVRGPTRRGSTRWRRRSRSRRRPTSRRRSTT